MFPLFNWLLFYDVSRISFDVMWAATGDEWRCVLIMANRSPAGQPNSSKFKYFLSVVQWDNTSCSTNVTCIVHLGGKGPGKWHSLQRTCISLHFFNNCKAPQLLRSLSDSVWTAGIINSWSYWNIIILQNIQEKKNGENNPIALGKERNRKNSLIWQWFRGYCNCQVLHHDFNEMWQMWSRKLQML